jgi:drug/metabolite transporter (DMT)-like permease
MQRRQEAAVAATIQEHDDARLRALAIAAIAVTVLMWGLSSVAIKAVAPSGLVTALYRCWFAIPVLWLTVLAPRVRRRLDAAWLRAALIGGGLFSIHQLLYFTSLKRTTVTNVAMIGALQPALVLVVAGRLFGEHPSLGAVLWSLLALVGTTVVVLGAIGAPSWSGGGDALAVLNLFAFTAYFLASKRIRARVGAWEYVVGMTTVSGAVLLVAALVTGQNLSAPVGWEWGVLVALAVFPGTLGHVLTNWAHLHVSAFGSSMLLLAVPVVASLGAVGFLGEPLGRLQLAGSALVLFAIANVVRSLSRPAREALSDSVATGECP